MAFNDTHRTARDPCLKGYKVIAFEVLAGKTIYKGDQVRIAAAGYALAGDGSASLAQYDVFAGIALETVTAPATNSGANAVKVRVLTEGIFNSYDGSLNANELGTWAHCGATSAYTSTSSASTLCTTTGNDDANDFVSIGPIVGIARKDTIPDAASSTDYRVLLQTLRQAFQH